MVKKNGKKSCWGCGYDYLYSSDNWTEQDLTPTRIYGVQELVCPDCVDEIPEDAGEVIYG